MLSQFIRKYVPHSCCSVDERTLKSHRVAFSSSEHDGIRIADSARYSFTCKFPFRDYFLADTHHHTIYHLEEKCQI